RKEDAGIVKAVDNDDEADIERKADCAVLPEQGPPDRPGEQDQQRRYDEPLQLHEREREQATHPSIALAPSRLAFARLPSGSRTATRRRGRVRRRRRALSARPRRANGNATRSAAATSIRK